MDRSSFLSTLIVSNSPLIIVTCFFICEHWELNSNKQVLNHNCCTRIFTNVELFEGVHSVLVNSLKRIRNVSVISIITPPCGWFKHVSVHRWLLVVFCFLCNSMPFIVIPVALWVHFHVRVMVVHVQLRQWVDVIDADDAFYLFTEIFNVSRWWWYDNVSN